MKFRIVRGGICKTTGKPWGVGLTYDAPSLAEALKNEAADTAQVFPDRVFSIANRSPVIRVFELVEVPESQWKK